MRFVYTFSLLIGSLNCQRLSVDLNIEEHGTRYRQTVEYDPVTKAVTYRVPQHNDVDSTVNIIHAASNTMLTMTEGIEGRQCLLHSAPIGFEPETHALGAFAMSANNETLTPGRAKIISYLNYHKGKISQGERKALLDSMQTLCEGIDIVRVEQIPVTEEEFRDKTVFPAFMNNTIGQGHPRFKREISFCDTGNACGKNIPGGRHCYWEVIPHVSSGTMELDHVRSAEWQCVVCCQDGSRSNGMCDCDDVNTDTFGGCQNVARR